MVAAKEEEASKMHHIWMMRNSIWCGTMTAATRPSDYLRDIDHI
jgi:hypothetical protein